MRQSTVASGVLLAFLARVVRTWEFGALFRRVLCSGSLVSRCLGVARGLQVLGSSGDAFLWDAMLGSTVNTCSASVRDVLWTNCTHFLRCCELES